jgi:acyl dehydratase
MGVDPQKLLNWPFQEKRHSYSARDAIIYALGVGLPLAEGESEDLAFITGNEPRVLPTFAVTLASPGMWVKAPELEIDWVRLLHVGQSVHFGMPLPPQGEVIGIAQIKSLYDRGVDKGAICIVERRITDAASGAHYCTIDQTLMLRGNGGFGGEPPPSADVQPIPSRAPDLNETIRISHRGALIYRLSGDLNPLHTDYAVAKRAGFERPILHGLASYGLAGALIVLRLCGGDPARLKTLDVRFSGVVFPGESMEFTAWVQDGRVQFEAHVGQRKVLDQGVAILD